MELRKDYDTRRLILARARNSTGLWFPPYGASGLAPIEWGPEAAALGWYIVHNGDEKVHLPENLMEEISEWMARSYDKKNSGVTKGGLALARKLADIFGNQKQIEFAGHVVLPKGPLGYPVPHSREFVFGEEFVRARNRRDFRSVTSYRTFLSFVVREEMSAEQQKEIFPTPFHLGSGLSIDENDLSWAKLASALAGEVVTNANDQYKQIRAKLPAALGAHVVEPKGTDECGKENLSKWLKVIGMIHVLMDRKVNGKAPQLMKMLTLPEDGGDFSLSLTSIYPFESARESAWLIGDLKSLLGSELSDYKYRWIVRLYEDLIPLVNRLIGSIRERLWGDSQDLGASGWTFERVVEAISGYVPKISQIAIPLDEDLFRHIHLLEYVHFSVGYPQLIDVARTTCRIKPISDELEDWLTDAGFVEQGKDDLILIGDVPAFAYAHQEVIKRLMDEAIGDYWSGRPEPKIKRSQWPGKRTRPTDMSVQDFERLVEVGQNLVKMHCWMQDNEFPSDLSTTPIQLVAAFCCVWFTIDDLTAFEPKWQGGGTQAGKLSESLEKPIFGEESGMDKMPMEHRHILSLRTSHFENAIQGRSNLADQNLALITLLLKKVREICASNDMKTVSSQLMRFQFFIQQGLWRGQ